MIKVDLGGIGSGGAWLTVNADSSGYRATPDITADITARIHDLEQYFEARSVSAMRCIHTLEHLNRDDIAGTLFYWRCFLKPGGSLLIVVPDMGAIATQYADGIIPFDVVAALAYGDTPSYQSTKNPGELHRWGYDEETLRRDLTVAGYVDIQLADDDYWPATWLFDYPAYAYTGLVGKWSVPNLRMIGVTP